MRSLISFILFLTVFFTLYGLLHYYLYRKLTRALTVTWPFNALILIVFLLMLLAPVLVNIFARQGSHLLATFLGYLGYTWMGALFLFFSSSNSDLSHTHVLPYLSVIGSSKARGGR